MQLVKSVVINTHNEQVNLQACISSVKSWADEIVVVDMDSHDQTQKIARDNHLKLFIHPYVGYVEPARNFAISKARGKWIFIIDADERANPELLSKFDQIIQADHIDYVWVPRSNIIFNVRIEHARWWPDYNIRFFKKNSVIWNDQIHSVPQAKGNGFYLDPKPEFSLQHLHYQTISQFVSRLDRYTDQQSEFLISQGYNFAWPDLLQKPANEFFSRYFAGQGYKDGLHGLVLSLLQAFSEFILYLKVWEKNNKFKQQDVTAHQLSKVTSKLVQDYHFWLSQSQSRISQKIIHKIKSKFPW